VEVPKLIELIAQHHVSHLLSLPLYALLLEQAKPEQLTSVPSLSRVRLVQASWLNVTLTWQKHLCLTNMAQQKEQFGAVYTIAALRNSDVRIRAPLR